MAIVYFHRNPTTHEIFYVGISSSNVRPHETRRRSKAWKQYVKDNGFYVEIYKSGIEYDHAKLIEMELIRRYGRVIDGTGSLLNITKGGDGHYGYTLSQEFRDKVSKRMKGSNKKPESIEKTRQANIGKHKPMHQRIAHSIRMSGENNPNYGKPRSPETIEKIRRSNCGKKIPQDVIEKIAKAHMKKVINTKTGVIYNQASEVPMDCHISYFRKKLRGDVYNDTDYQYLNNYNK